MWRSGALAVQVGLENRGHLLLAGLRPQLQLGLASAATTSGSTFSYSTSIASISPGLLRSSGSGRFKCDTVVGPVLICTIGPFLRGRIHSRIAFARTHSRHPVCIGIIENRGELSHDLVAKRLNETILRLASAIERR